MLKCIPQFVEEIWGDESLGKLYGVDGKIGEVWLCSGHPERKTKLVDEKGNEVSWDYVTKIWGFERFPFLVKHIKTSQWLSVQVHPDDDVARSAGEPWGKPEMWYFLKDGTLINGLQNGALERLKSGDRNWNELLSFTHVRNGQAMYIKPGTVHAIGPGMELYEFQMTSDITYRFYDWDRGRKTHFEEALRVAQDIKAEPFDFKRLETDHFKIELFDKVKAEGKAVCLAIESSGIPSSYILADGEEFFFNNTTFVMTLP
ncbi:type I phosphomannose isomerase catalytic subunit [Athalassotoga sp.]|uniref:type I phosphomannose isomerase catalytic subunit n=1 Tax=Athalassotoga sp. TaxID=2022597 RepID=UPI003CFBD6F5